MNNQLFYDNKYDTSTFQNIDQTNSINSGYCPLNGIVQSTPVSKIFFSKQNIQLLQTALQQTVYVKSNGVFKIGKQSELELLSIMRSIYLQYSQNLKCKIKEQIRALDKRVIDYSVNIILSNAKQQAGYIKDIENQPETIKRAESTSTVGMKLQERKQFI